MCGWRSLARSTLTDVKTGLYSLLTVPSIEGFAVRFWNNEVVAAWNNSERKSLAYIMMEI